MLHWLFADPVAKHNDEMAVVISPLLPYVLTKLLKAPPDPCHTATALVASETGFVPEGALEGVSIPTVIAEGTVEGLFPLNVQVPTVQVLP